MAAVRSRTRRSDLSQFSGNFLSSTQGKSSREHLISDQSWQEDASSSAEAPADDNGVALPPRVGWQGAVVAVLGLYDKGKTFILNHLTDQKLPSGKKVGTEGPASTTPHPPIAYPPT